MLAGVAVMLLLVPVNAVIAMKTKTYQVGGPAITVEWTLPHCTEGVAVSPQLGHSPVSP